VLAIPVLLPLPHKLEAAQRSPGHRLTLAVSPLTVDGVFRGLCAPWSDETSTGGV